MSESPDNAGVRIPPPLFYAAAVVVGLLLDGVHSLPITPITVGSGFSRIVPVVGWLLIAGWAFLMFGAFVLFRRHRTSVLPIRPATALVVAGPYRFTRNPMYVGLALLTVAFGLSLNTWWPIILLVPTLFIIRNYVIAREERYLHRRFGAEYGAYTRQVRRWL